MKSVSKNMTMSIIARLISLVAGLVVQRYLLLSFGSTLNGLTTSINQAMAYLVLLEAGLGTASVQALYDPLASNDWKKVSGILTATGREYKKISALFLALLIGVSVVIPLAVSGEVEFATAGLLTLITGGSYIVSYIMGGKYKALLDADRKIYILYILDSISVMTSCIFRVIALKAGQSIVLVQLINLACILIKNIGYVIYVKIKYRKVNYNQTPDIKAIGKRWNVLIHSLAGIVVNNTDVIILTLFGSLKTVSVYGVYNMVFGQLSSIVQTTFMQAPQSSFGQLYHIDRRAFKHAFELYEFIVSFILFVICTIAIILILPFVGLYTSGVQDIVYIDMFLPVLFTLILLMNQIRIPSLITINVAGAFKETQGGAIIEAIINISVSLLLFFFTGLGLYGLLIGTICSYLFRTVDVFLYAHRKLVDSSVSIAFRNFVVNLLTMVVLYCSFVLIAPVHTESMVGWIVKAIGISFVTVFVFGAVNYLFNRKKIIEIYSFIVLKFRHSEK